MTMEQKFSSVNARRRYDSSGRRERARQTRDQIVDVAEGMFLSGGYAATTVAAIAAAALVSVETIYKGFGRTWAEVKICRRWPRCSHL